MINLIGILVFLYIIYFIYINTLLSKLFTDLNIVPQRNNIHESNFDTQKYILSHLNELVLTNKSNTNNQSSESNLKLKKEVYYTVFSVVDDISVFKDISYKNIIIDALKHWQFNKGLIIHNWCLLDDSLHLIVSAKENNIKNLIDDLKIYISQSVILSIQSHNNENFKSNLLASLNKENFHNQLWKNNFELESILSKDSLINKVNFIHNIPRKLGIVALAEDYLYSSAKDYGIRAALIEVESII
jgi:REP element-mobilizing transposase RayT